MQGSNKASKNGHTFLFLIFYYIQTTTLLNKSALEVCFLAKKGRSIAFFGFFSFFS
jgi:hypothetical protein